MTRPTPVPSFSFLMVSALLALLGGGVPLAAEDREPEPLPLRFEAGEHVAILGNALADRMQHTGYLEALIHAHHPDHELVFRNLSAAGDEVDTWHRSDNFGSRNDWLGRVGADVVFAFYGFNESTGGEDGLDDFKANLEAFIRETRSQNYSGDGPPRIVLFSPIANERHRDRDFPDPAENNGNLAAYTEAMSEVAAANDVAFVDLFTPSRELFAAAADADESLTVNGLYLKDEGYRRLAPAAFRSLFDAAPPSDNPEKLREAVLDKNWTWHQRYRTIDAYNIHGGRSALAYLPGEGGFIYDRDPPEPRISNYQVMQKELGQRDVMTANRDERIWAIARGGDLEVDDSNLPPVPDVPTNHPGPEEDGSHPILGGEEAIEKMSLYSGLEVNLFADEEQFPELVNPVQIAWDTRGRLWVAVWPEYPGRTPTSETGDSLLVFEDTDGDGRADEMTTFATDLNAPTGFQFFEDGVLVMQAPDLWFLRDTTGDGKADWKERVLMGMDSADSHHTANALAYDPGGAIYLSDGTFHRTQVETFWEPVRNRNGGIYRFVPRTGRFEVFAAYDFANPHGRVFDRWGNSLITDATSNNNYFGAAFSGRIDLEVGKHPGMKTFWDRPARPAAGTGLLTSRHFPDELQGNFLNLNVISFQGIFNVEVREEGSGLKGETRDYLLRSEDPNFIPSDIKVGPDGAVYFSDWQNPIVGHMQHHLRDPNRDDQHGRIYRISHGERPLLEPPHIHGAPISDLLDLLKEFEDHVRQLAKLELSQHDSGDVIPALNEWMENLDTEDPEYEHHMMEALWVHQWQNVVDADLLDRMLESPDPRARAAAGRVLCYWRDEVSGSLERFMTLASDDHPRVRLEAARGASFYRRAEAAEVALAVLEKPMDDYLDYTLTETLRQLERYWKPALLAGESLTVENPDALERLMDFFSTGELTELPAREPVVATLLARPDAGDTARLTALRALARERDADPVAVLLSVLEDVDGESADRVARLLPMQNADELAGSREQLAQVAREHESGSVRESAWAAVIQADGSFDPAWTQSRDPEALSDLVGGIPRIPNPGLRNEAYEKVHALLDGDPGQSPELRRAAIRAIGAMSRDRENTFRALTDLIADGREPVLAARSLRSLPRETWSEDGARKAAEGLVAWAKDIPDSERTNQDYVETVQLAAELAGSLSGSEASALLRELSDLRVAVFVVRAVREEMRFDTDRIVVEAGRPFELTFENPDFMPHNLLIVEPGARQTIGPIADRMRPDDLDSEGRAYVPDRPEVLAATMLLETGESETLRITAPDEEGVYEFVCTFPGHWPVMWGEIVVTGDIDAYLAEQTQNGTSPASRDGQ